jgi:hypothetical protein
VDPNDPVLIISDKASLMAELGISAQDFADVEDKARRLGELHFFDEEYITTRSEAERSRLIQEQTAYREATKNNGTAIRSTREPYVSALDGWLEGLLRAKNYYAILILGGDNVIPYPILDNPTSDSDPWVFTDDVYGDTDHDADSIVDYPVARIPDGGDRTLVLNQLSRTEAPASGHYGLGNINRHGAEKVAAIYGGEAAFETCDPNTDVSFGDDLRYTYFMLHGSDQDTTVWWGEHTNSSQMPYPEGLKVANAANSGIVASAACYGAYTIGKTPADSIALSFLKSGSWAFVGSTGISYSGDYPKEPRKFLDVNSGRFYKLFFDRVTQGTDPMSAFYYTKVEYAQNAKIDSEQKIMHEYQFYGMPKVPPQVTPVPTTPAPPGVTAIPPQPPGGSAETATVLLLDVSGSMGRNWQGGVKMDSAQQAALSAVDMIEQESQASGVRHEIAVASFSSGSWLELPLSPDYSRARQAIQSLYPLDGTNMGVGIQEANGALVGTANARKIIILLSDGLSNEGLSADQILSGPVQEAVRAGTCIYTVGFGDAGDLDENLLRQIAQTACGQYSYASTPYDLQRVYVEIRHRSSGGTVIDRFTGQVRQGETTPPRSVQVPVGQGELHVTGTYAGSRLDLVLTDPRGRRVDVSYPSATLATYARMAYTIIMDPLPGIWQVAVFGAEVPENVLDYEVILSTRPTVGPGTSSGAGVVLLIVLLAMVVGGGLTAAILYSQSRSTPGPARAMPVAGVQIAGMAGGGAGFRQGVLQIGRESSHELVLSDPRVSRSHARIVHTAQGYVIEDLQSTNGTHVNGERITSQYLRPGDQIQVGDTHLIFWLGGSQ